MFEILNFVRKEIIVILFAMAPISELRGAIPIGISLGLSPIHSTIISILGNIAIVPLLLLILNPVMNYFEKTYLFSKTIGWVKRRTLAKTKKTISKYKLLGLFILAAIPLPGTGAWTASIAASLLKIKFKDALLAIGAGVIVAGAIVYSLSYALLS